MKNKEWSAGELKNKIEAYCATTERCEMEIRLRLRQWHCDETLEDELVEHLTRENFFSTERYCAAFVHDKLVFQGWGRIKIEYMLRNKRVPLEAIFHALERIDETEYFRILNHLIDKRMTRLSEEDKQKILSCHLPEMFVPFFIQRGFTLSEIKDAILYRGNN